MKNFSKKMLGFGLLSAMTLFISVNVPTVRATSSESTASCTPTISKEKVKQTSVTLKITCSDLKNTRVNVKVLVENNDDDDSTSNKVFTTTLGKTGSSTIKVSSLDSSNSYTFKAKVKKTSKSEYSGYSNAIDVTTKGADYDISFDQIKNITEDSVKVVVSSNDLEDKAVSLQVAYKKKSSWTTKTYSLTLDSDGEGSVTVSGLKSATAYDFKVRIKKSGDSTYTAYTATKSATTDEE